MKHITGQPCSCAVRSKCIDSRQLDSWRRRRYICPKCQVRWTTVEVAVDDNHEPVTANFEREITVHMKNKIIKFIQEL